jgi:hypothetical protein
MRVIFLAVLFYNVSVFSMTLNEWNKISKTEKLDYFEKNLPDLELDINLKKVHRINNDPKYKKFQRKISFVLNKMQNYETEIETEVDDYMFALVGPVQRTFQVYISDDNQFLGGNMYYFQEGCYHVDENEEFFDQTGYYPDWKAAEANKCLNEDVSWGASSTTDNFFVELEHDEYMEWTGH